MSVDVAVEVTPQVGFALWLALAGLMGALLSMNAVCAGCSISRRSWAGVTVSVIGAAASWGGLMNAAVKVGDWAELLLG